MKRITSFIISLVAAGLFLTGCTHEANIRNNVALSDIVDFHSEKQEAYLDSDYLKILHYAKGKRNMSSPEPIIISWYGDASSAYTVCISETDDMKNAVSYAVSGTELSVYNLKTDTHYYWTYTSDDYTSEIFEFKTSDDAPRNLFVDGVKNVRDLGGWETESGKRTNQGLIYRCARLNKSSSETPVIEITDSGIAEMKDNLGVRAEIDLRKSDGETGAITQSPLGEGVEYYSCPMVWEGDIYIDNRQQILNVFEILSDETNYPIIFHCNIGTDRTGMIAFLINALCGVSEEDIKRDYLFSNFADINGSRSVNDLEKSGYYNAVMKAEGESLSEKAYNSLVSLGVKEAQLDAVLSIMLGE